MYYMKIYLIGIGGIGVSALAQYYLAKGHEIFGSDLVSSEITEFLKNKGVSFSKPEAPDLVVFSPAVKKDNLELKEFMDKGVKCLSYPEALGELTKDYFTIAVAGAHGKSTTTAMVALILTKAGLDPTVIVGTKLKEFGGSNFRMGKSKFLVIEACEYEDSFLNYWPKIIVITNIDKEHLDYFKNLNNVVKSFQRFAEKLPVNGALVINKDDKNSKKIKPKIKIQNFGIRQKEAGKMKKIQKIPGKHNVYNALAALTVARQLGISDEISFKALSEYEGSWRRFEIKNVNINGKKIDVISDYGHHPTEVLATFNSAREKYPDKKILCVFQPHQYQRTYYLFNDFVKVFRKAPIDKVVVTDIYDVAGREEKNINKKTSSEKLVKKIGRKNVVYVSLRHTEKFVRKNISDFDILIIMGAGDIYKLVDKF